MLLRRHGLKVLVGIGLGIAFLVLALRRVDWENFNAVFQQSNFSLALAPSVFILVGLILKGLRITWLSQGNSANWDIYTQAVAIGLGVNSLVPLRAGEAAKIVYLAKGASAGYLKAGMLVAAERILDFCSLGAIMGVAILTNGALFNLWLRRAAAYSGNPKTALIGLVLGSALLILTSAGLVYKNVWNLKSRMMSFWLSTKSQLMDVLKEFGGRLGISLALSMSAWLCDTIFLGLLAMVFHIPISIKEILFLQMVVSLAYVSSVSPGAIGVYELTGSWALGNMGIESGLALAFLLTAHALLYLLTLSATALSLIRAGWITGSTQGAGS